MLGGRIRTSDWLIQSQPMTSVESEREFPSNLAIPERKESAGRPTNTPNQSITPNQSTNSVVGVATPCPRCRGRDGRRRRTPGRRSALHARNQGTSETLGRRVELGSSDLPWPNETEGLLEELPDRLHGTASAGTAFRSHGDPAAISVPIRDSEKPYFTTTMSSTLGLTATRRTGPADALSGPAVGI